jgi:putative hydrolase of the HAD superfamily
MRSASAVDLVTVDAFGTLVELVDPYDRLGAALAARGVKRDRDAVAAAFAAEAAYYIPRSYEGYDAASLARLRRECVAVFLAELGAELDPGEFSPTYVEALEFRPMAGAKAGLERLRSAGIALACVGNWDISLAGHLAAIGLSSYFGTVVTSAEARAAKPDPAPFRLALDRMGMHASRALHIGDSEADREGASAAGLAFEPAPLATLPSRLGL